MLGNPLGADTPWEQTPPRTRHPQEQTPTGPGTPWDQAPPGADPHPGPGTPWDQAPPGADPQHQAPPAPGAVHGGRYGQQAGSMHPTRMQSCFRG